jgi:putative MATE family efflux protein
MLKDMTKGNPMKLIIGFALPMLIGNIFQQLYNIVNTIIVGKYLGEDALAGVGTTGSVIFFMTSLVIGLSNGAGIIIAQCFGCKNYDRMKKAITALLFISSIFAILLSVAGNLLTSMFLNLLSVPDNLRGYSIDYLSILFTYIAGSIAFNVAATILRSLGDSKTPLYYLILASFINIALDIVLIRFVGLGVSGAAYATVISQTISALLCFRHIWQYRDKLNLSGLPKRPEKTMIFLIFQTGVPSAFQSCAISIGGMSVQRLINSFGDSVMAATAAATKVDSIAIQIVLSIGSAMSVFTSQNIGMGNFERIRTGLRRTLLLMISSCITIAIIVFIFKEKLMAIFLDATKAQESIQIGAHYLSIIGIAYVIAGIMQSYQNLIRGAGDVNICMVAGLSELSARIVFAYVLAHYIGITGIFLATPISWACGCIIPVARYYSGKWKTKRLG